MLLHLSDLSDEPLHRQLQRQLRARILSGELEEGGSLPSIRSLAREVKVSVITVQRAYEDLERDGLIHARRGKGFFVAPLEAGARRQMAADAARAAFGPAIAAALAEGLERGDIQELVAHILAQEGSET